MSAEEIPNSTLYIIGAGFSVPVGLPTAAHLTPAIFADVRAQHGVDTILERDWRRYREFAAAMREPPDFEAFMSWLDLEEFLLLEGSERRTEFGSASQHLVRNAIGRIIHRCTDDSLDKLYRSPGLDRYRRFVSEVGEHDTVVTFNYDLVLERLFEVVGRPYRRFWNRMSDVDEYSSTVDNEAENGEVLLLKPHGSIDWISSKPWDSFNSRPYST